jgi:hypothetical protein
MFGSGSGVKHPGPATLDGRVCVERLMKIYLKLSGMQIQY